MHKADWVLILAAVMCCSLLLFTPTHPGNKYLIIYENGKMIERVALSDSQNLTRKFLHNEVLIINGSVRMQHADCPDQDCVKSGVIDKSGQMIACLPNKLSLRIVAEKADIDDVAK
ncbi:MAG: NusG domain II-containing protein [Negativicutes bacterium]|jgi:hypothetical protein